MNKNFEFYIKEGILSIKDTDENRQSLYNYISKNKMEKIAPGLYAFKDTIIDEAFILSKRCPKGIISHDDALYYHNLSEREPFTHSITIYTGYKPTRLTDSGYKVYTIKKDLLDVGRINAINQFGHEIPTYDLERTICDLIRSRNNFEAQDFNYAIKTYANRKDKNLNLLMEYAKLFHVDKILQQYIEVLI